MWPPDGDDVIISTYTLLHDVSMGLTLTHENEGDVTDTDTQTQRKINSHLDDVSKN